MNSDQVKSLVATLLKVAGGALIAHGANADLVNSVATSADLIQIISGAVIAGAAALWSHFTHASAPAAP